ncbi:hypothetical protein, partial [[Eubacterium] cellulosolvens]
MDKKIALIIVIILLITAALAGCFGESESKKPKKPELEPTHGEYPAETGWIQSSGDLATDEKGPFLIATGTITLILNHTNVFAAQIDITFDDYDSAHSGTDGASPADEVDITISTGGFNESGSGTTPTSISFDLMGNTTTDSEQESLPSEITFNVHAVCYCETTYPITGRPSAFILATRDQGVAYEISASYQYLAE